MSRPTKGYYVKPCTRTTTPRCIIGVHVTTKPDPDTPATANSVTKVIDYVTTSHTIRNWTGWTPIQTIAHGTHHAFWEWLESESWQQRMIHLYARCAADSLSLLRMWERLDSVGVHRLNTRSASASGVSDGTTSSRYGIRSLILSLRTNVVDYERFGTRYVWTSLTQYLPLRYDEIAKMVGTEIAGGEQVQARGIESEGCIQNPSYLTVRAMQHLSGWWKGHKGGPWAISIGGLASRFLRSRLPARTLCTHRHDEALSLERSACFGGRVCTWYVGTVAQRCTVDREQYRHSVTSAVNTIDGPVHVVDVRSMYPYLLSSRKYPVKLIGYERGMPISDLADLLRYVCVVARVELNTDRAEYPYRSDDAVIYPTGTFTTALCGPDLQYACDNGHIVRVHCAALYQRGTPFAASAMELLSAREIARVAGDTGTDTVVKLLSNSISGKLAQRHTVWVPCQDEQPPLDEFGEVRRWGTFIRSVPIVGGVDDGESRHVMTRVPHESCNGRAIHRYRLIAGMVERLERDSTGTGTLQAAYAYLTAYGRCLMRDVRSAMPERSVLLQDTDGLWVTDSGLEALTRSAIPLGNLPGDIRVTQRIRHARIYGPKHYWCDGQWTLSGFANPSVDDTGRVVVDQQTTNAIRGNPTEPPHSVREFTRRSELLLIHLHGHQGLDGWISPYHVSEGVRQPQQLSDDA